MSPDARRTAIVDAAQALFYARGWDAVTISDVLAEAGISKGGFYHHFSAKEDLLDAIVERLVARALEGTATARDAITGDALTRFNAFIGAMNRWKADLGPELRFFTDVMLRPGNDVLFQRVVATSNEATLPILRKLIKAGIDEGTFDTPDTEIAAEVIVALGQEERRAVLRSAIAAAELGDMDEAVRLLDARMRAEGRLIDRLLGLPAGSILLSHPADYRLMLGAMKPSQNPGGGA
ncbi:TetR/AcrR family transcriptional regulator [Phaeovulum sp.]|uniref:TetR/AcrR family transcriptional regulator n=1 Tax=Phaeovulum sp. TaxID=2934796 RepID=UPI0035617F28